MQLWAGLNRLLERRSMKLGLEHHDYQYAFGELADRAHCLAA